MCVNNCSNVNGTVIFVVCCQSCLLTVYKKTIVLMLMEMSFCCFLEKFSSFLSSGFVQVNNCFNINGNVIFVLCYHSCLLILYK